MSPGGPSAGVVFLGNDRWSVPSLEALAASSHRVALVVTRGPRPAGRGSALRPTAVARAARSMGLPLLETDSVRSGEGFDAVTTVHPQHLVVVAYGELLPPSVLSIAAGGAVNVHFSLLPALRGADPVRHAILEGLETTGVTTMLIDEGLDTGPLLLQKEEAVSETDDAGSLGDRLATIGGGLLVETLGLLRHGEVVPIPQDPARASYAPMLDPRGRQLDWSEDPVSIVRRVRAMSPAPGAATTFRGSPLKVLRAATAEGSGDLGRVIDILSAGPAVAAGSGAVVLTEVAPAGRKRMSGADFARGFHPEGELLG